MAAQPPDPPANTWLFLESAYVKHSPSRRQLTLEQDLKNRESVHDFLVKLGSQLKLDSLTLFAATVYISRFYMRVPITTSKYFVASAALAISCKLHDTYRAPDKIALAACQLKNPNRVVTDNTDVFWQWRDQLLYREELILKNLNFELQVDFPYPIRDALLEEDGGSDRETYSAFYDKKNDIIKNSVALVELLSALPVLVAYDVETFFGAVLVSVVAEAAERFSLPDMKLPPDYISKNLHRTPTLCLRCYKYIFKLLQYSHSKDPKLVSHKTAYKRIKRIPEDQYYKYAGFSP